MALHTDDDPPHHFCSRFWYFNPLNMGLQGHPPHACHHHQKRLISTTAHNHHPFTDSPVHNHNPHHVPYVIWPWLGTLLCSGTSAKKTNTHSALFDPATLVHHHHQLLSLITNLIHTIMAPVCSFDESPLGWSHRCIVSAPPQFLDGREKKKKREPSTAHLSRSPRLCLPPNNHTHLLQIPCHLSIPTPRAVLFTHRPRVLPAAARHTRK